MLYGQLQDFTIDNATLKGIKITIPFPAKSAIVRLPSNEEFLEFFKADKKKKSATPEEQSLELFKKIRLDQGPEFDEFEATSAIDAITRSRGMSFERIGDCYEISVETAFDTTEHTLSIPTQKQITMFRRAAVKNFLGAAVNLYEELTKQIEGYADGITVKDVPPHHKLDAINQVFSALDSLDPLLASDPNS